MTASVSTDKLSSVTSFIRQKLTCSRISVKDLAIVVGSLAALRRLRTSGTACHSFLLQGYQDARRQIWVVGFSSS